MTVGVLPDDVLGLVVVLVFVVLAMVVTLGFAGVSEGGVLVAVLAPVLAVSAAFTLSARFSITLFWCFSFAT